MQTRIEKLVVIEKIMNKIDNRYEAVRVIAREARRLNSLVIRGAEVDDDFKPTTAAMRRLFEDKIQYEFVERTEDPDELFGE
jgi:DNA-directed RNA polymerase omega subunit